MFKTSWNIKTFEFRISFGFRISDFGFYFHFFHHANHHKNINRGKPHRLHKAAGVYKIYLLIPASGDHMHGPEIQAHKKAEKDKGGPPGQKPVGLFGGHDSPGNFARGHP